jgi:hypothetical protein
MGHFGDGVQLPPQQIGSDGDKVGPILLGVEVSAEDLTEAARHSPLPDFPLKL